MCFGAEATPCDATDERPSSPPEGKSPARDDSRTTGERITLYAFFKVLKESLEIQNQRFEEHDLKFNQRFEEHNLKLNQRFIELAERMDVIDKRYKDQDRHFLEQDQRFEHRERPFQRRDEKSVK